MHGSSVRWHKFSKSNVQLTSCFSVAGVDTTSTLLSYLFWELSRRKDIMKHLQAEIDEYMSDRRVVPDFATLCKMPYLNAFIKEG